jgi:(2R)-sulfolactate sulfo-lyase subunit alpha
MHQALAHEPGDDVAVAVTPIAAGDPVVVAYLDSDHIETVEARGAVPYGHKIAVHDRAAGDEVIEYGLRIGIASAGIAKGDYVHTHNLRSARW